MIQKTPITKSGYDRLQIELKRLKTVERPSVIQAISEARAHGDLSENAEYDAAKERQAFVEAKIAELDDLLARAEIVDPSTINQDHVVFGATVVLLDTDKDIEVTYRIVGDPESAPEKGDLGISTPVARALIGKSVDDEIVVKAPGGDRFYEVVSIRYE